MDEFRVADLPDLEEALACLRPVLQTRLELGTAMMLRAGGLHGFPIPHLPLGLRVGTALVIDDGETLSWISVPALARWEVGFLELYARSLSNLGTDIGPGFSRVRHGSALHIFGSVDDDHFGASRPLSHKVAARCEVVGDPLFVPVSEDTSVVVGSEDERALRLAVRMAEDSENSLGGTPLAWANDHWADFRPAPDHPLHETLAVLGLTQEMEMHNAQTDLLRVAFADSHFVARVWVEKAPNGYQTACPWVEGIPQLLPETDLVQFVRSEGPADEPVAVARWSRVVEVVGHRLEKTRLYPPRYLVESFPDSDELAALRS